MDLLMTMMSKAEAERRILELAPYAILGTEPEAAFDRLAGLAGQMLAAPIALVSFFGRERQWLKAKVGLQEDHVELQESFCFAMVASRRALAVGDLSSDPRFRDSRYVTEGGISSYLGVPLIGEGGEVIGSIAVADKVRRDFTTRELGFLEQLAQIAMDELALRLAGRELEMELARRKEAETQLELERRRYEHLAYHDPLTGLPNRLAFQRRLSEAGAGACVMMIDLDLFKPINDRHGHATGDAVLCTVAERIAAGVRHHDLAVRLGGDEFAVVLGEVDASTVEEIAHRILVEIAAPIRVGTAFHSVSASCGIAFLDVGEDLAGAVRRADVALYDAKLAGRNAFRLHPGAIEGATKA